MKRLERGPGHRVGREVLNLADIGSVHFLVSLSEGIMVGTEWSSKK